eukprot:scaffold6378_cov176-Amphora_coffeaeformis.AAC.7
MRTSLILLWSVLGVDAFVPPSRPTTASALTKTATTRLAAPPMTLQAVGPSSGMLMALAEQGGADLASSSPLMNYFLETLIANGVPALFSIIVIGFAAVMFGKSRRGQQADILETRNPVARLYEDLYGDQKQDDKMMSSFFGGRNNGKLQLPRNAGVPQLEYIKITNLNRQLDSYKYSLQAATQSKAAAAADYREASFGRALGRVLDGSVRQELLKAEAEFLDKGAELTTKIADIQTKLTQATVDKELESFGMKTVYDLDPAFNATTNETVAVVSKGKNKKIDKNELLSTLSKLQRDLQELELDFIQEVVHHVGPAHGASVRTALLGDVAVRGSGGLLRTLRDRPLRALLNGEESKPGNLYVTRFPGDTTASQVANLREEATAIIRSAKPGDEVLVVLQTGGGTVTGYGLAAAQLLRFKDAGLKLTIAVEQVAASGGYMMCCVADRIVASPFAVLGSIGVISDIPNVYDRLKKEGIEFQTVTAGKFKRTLTPTKKVTKEDFEKSKQDVEEILVLFRDFVAQNRPQLDIHDVATGETWFGTAALEKKLCDEIKTVDDVLMDYVDEGFNVYEVKYEPPIETPFGKLVLGGASADSSSRMDGSDAPWLRKAVRWVVRTIASEIKAELGSTMDVNIPLEQRYMAKDDTASRIKSD